MASVARPAAGAQGQRPERRTLRLAMTKNTSRGKELLLRATVPRGESTDLHVQRLRESIVPFSDALKAAATCDLPAHPVRVKRGIAYYNRKGKVNVDVLIARLDVCAELVPVVDALQSFQTISMPGPYDGLMEARWDSGQAEEEVLILGIPSGVVLEELQAGIIEQGVQVRDLQWEMEAGLPRSDAARGFFPGRAPKAIVLVEYDTTLRCDIKSHIPVAPKLRRAVNHPGRSTAGQSQSYLSAVAPGAVTPASFPLLPGAVALRAGSAAALATAARGLGTQVDRPVPAQGAAAAGTSLTTGSVGAPRLNSTTMALAVSGGAAQEPAECEAAAGGSSPGHVGRAGAIGTMCSAATTPAQHRPETGGQSAVQIVPTSVTCPGESGHSVRPEVIPAVAAGSDDIRMASGIRAQSPADVENDPPLKRTRGATARTRLGPAESPEIAMTESTPSPPSINATQ